MFTTSFCKICNSQSTKLLSSLVLKKYDITYFKCTSCGFIQTENPFWLEEAYNSAITQLDIGLVSRNLHYAEVLDSFFEKRLLNEKGIYLDFAGGYGLFVRLMRDKGINFFRQDVYCENIFAKHFDLKDLPENQKFDAVTAFEVFEHLVDPRDCVEEILQYTDVLIFSTEIQPEGELNPKTWWYFTPETGQHISLFSINSLHKIAELEKLFFYSNGHNLHIFSKFSLTFDPFKIPNYNPIQRIRNKIFNLLSPKRSKSERESLLQKDFYYIKGLD